MKICKISIIILGITMLLLSSAIVLAETETDDQGDVWHFVYPYWQEQTVGNQPNVDIKEIKAEIIGDQITLSMTLWPGGTFSRNEYGKVGYIMFFNTSDAYYMMSYTDITGTEPYGGALGLSLDGSYPMPSTGEVIVNGETISVTMDKAGDDTTAIELYGTAWMYEDYGAEQYIRDQWHDFVGDYNWNPDLEEDDTSQETDETEGDDDTSSDDSDGGTSTGTPGFEAIAVIASIGIIYFTLRRKK